MAGEALETARQEFRSLNRRSQARAAIPEAWKELVGKGSEEPFEFLATNVELKTEIRPDGLRGRAFCCVRPQGDHLVFTKTGVARPVVIPKDAAVPVFIIKNNLRNGGVSRDRYFELLGQ